MQVLKTIKSLIKAINVKQHVRQGKLVRGYVRTGAPKKKVKKRVAIKLDKWQDINKEINKNIGWLIYLAKAIAEVHGVPIQFVDGQPMGDFADIVAEGKMGMLYGGQEWHGQKKHKVDRLTQMKFRGKQRMRKIAKRLKSSIDLPRDLIRQLAIVSAAKEQFMKQSGGIPPTNEDLAEMVTLHHRTENGSKELTFDEKVARIEVLKMEREKQYSEDIVKRPDVYESDHSLWTLHTYDQRLQRELVHDALNSALERKIITPRERDILFLRFYIDDPVKSQGRNVRSFATIANIINEKTGLKHVRMKYKVGDTLRTYPMRQKKIRKGPNRGKKYYVMYKTPVTLKIVEIKRKYWIGERNGRLLRVKGSVPFKKPEVVKKATIHRIYESAADKLIADKKTNKRLRAALQLTLKALRLNFSKEMKIAA